MQHGKEMNKPLQLRARTHAPSRPIFSLCANAFASCVCFGPLSPTPRSPFAGRLHLTGAGKMASRLLFGGALLQLAADTAGMVGGGSTGKLDGCLKQSQCLDISVTPVDLADTHCSLTGSCFYEACITISLGGDCPKESTDTISHICDQSDDNGCPNPASDIVPTKPQWDATGTQQEGVGSGTRQCQIGAAGTGLQFLYKDGNSCSDSLAAGDVIVSGSDASVTCRPSEDGNPLTVRGLVCSLFWQLKLVAESVRVHRRPEFGGESGERSEPTGCMTRSNHALSEPVELVVDLLGSVGGATSVLRSLTHNVSLLQ